MRSTWRLIYIRTAGFLDNVARQPDAVRRRLGYLPRDFGLYDNLTAFEMPDYFARLKGARSRARVLELIASLFGRTWFQSRKRR
jgi:ABC-type multidrug transport system ATPase subunit